MRQSFNVLSAHRNIQTNTHYIHYMVEKTKFYFIHFGWGGGGGGRVIMFTKKKPKEIYNAAVKNCTFTVMYIYCNIHLLLNSGDFIIIVVCKIKLCSLIRVYLSYIIDWPTI